MSIARGIQSAIFFYLSCAPCVGQAHQRRRRKEARRDRREKAALELESPNTYRHPDPSSTNPHWNEEIALGPGPPPRGKKRGKRNIGTAGTQSTTRSRIYSDLEEEEEVAGIQIGVSPAGSETTLSDGRWSRQREQREDEEPWGTETLSSRGGPRVSSSAGSATGLVVPSRPSTGRSASESYYTARPPPVNELHPPVVTALSPNAGANNWMLAPPPSAKVMSGKKKSPRSRSGSGTSSRIDVSLQREMSQRKIEQKYKRGETPEVPPGSRGSSFYGSPKQASSPSLSTKKYSLERRSIAEDSDASDDTLPRDKRHDSGNHLASISPNVERGSPKRPQATRQKLSTVHSGESLAKRPNPARASTQMALKSTVQHKENISELPMRSRSANKAIKKPAPLVIRDSSLNLLQELVSPNALLNSQFVKSPTLEARIQLPPTNSSEDLQLRSLSPWFPADDFVVAHDGSDSDPTQNSRLRWSMDI